MPSPADDIAAFLAAIPELGLTLGGNLRLGDEQPALGGVPTACVFVKDDEDGGERTPYQGAGSDLFVEVSVTVRSPPAQKQGGRETAQAMMEALDRADVSGYYSVLVPDALPQYMGRDDSGAESFEFAVEVRWTRGVGV